MARHYGIPYMGSKQKLVDKIVPFILKRHPGVDSFYDLFGGGGSVSLYVVRKYPHLDVVYNERSKAISALMQHLKDGGDIPLDFVSRDEFESKYAGNDWYAGLLQCAWTFGNNQKSYLYGKPLEDFKRELAMLVTTGTADIDWLERTADELNKKEYVKDVSTRLFLNPKRYDEVPIIGERPIIYCDPPYEGTAEYREGAFNHKQFYDWCMAQTVPVYVSSYQVSDPRFKRVKAINTRSLLNSSKSKESSYNYENIYWNGVS